MTITVVGSAGAKGANGAAGGDDGAAGGAGGDATASQNTPVGSPPLTSLPQADATGGAGGDGGNGGGAAGYAGTAGNAGAGGDGGDATAFINNGAVYPASEQVFAEVYATGGAGGDAGIEGPGTLITGWGADGGAGGAASATGSTVGVVVPGTYDNPFVIVLATGGAGGTGTGPGHSGGAGGGVTVSGSLDNPLNSSDVFVTGHGGAGGVGLLGAAGGNGAAVTLDNAATAGPGTGDLELNQQAYGGDGGDGVIGGDGGAAAGTLTNDPTIANAGTLTLSDEVQGGAGGSVGTEAPGGSLYVEGAGGTATATGDATGGVISVVTIATAGAAGGFDGSADPNAAFAGIAGADATASANVTASGDNGGASAEAVGGAGGGGNGVGETGGLGGAATATASATNTGGGSISAGLGLTGGAGGDGTNGALAGDGRSETGDNLATASSDGGGIALYQTITGGSAGSGPGGAGGSASSTLTFSDPTGANGAVLLAGTATGGSTNGQQGVPTTTWHGGDATSLTDGSSAANVTIYASATGGDGGFGSGGDAVAKATGISDGTATISTTAIGGASHAKGGYLVGTALAVARGTGIKGTTSASASTSQVPNPTPGVSPVTNIAATATDPFAGSAVSYAQTGIGTGIALPGQAHGAEASALGAPVAGAISQVVASDPGLPALVGPSAQVLALGQLGGNHSNGGDGASQTLTTSVTVTVNQALITAGTDLKIALFNPQDQDTQGITAVDLGITLARPDFQPKHLLPHDFGNAGGAATFFDNNTIDLGAPPGNSGIFHITLDLDVTTDMIGSGFTGDFALVAEPPAAAAAPLAGPAVSAEDHAGGAVGAVTGWLASHTV